MKNRWVVPKRDQTWTIVIYSVIGLIILMGLIVFINYLVYYHSVQVSNRL